MRSGLILTLLIAAPCWSQTTTGKAETTGPCSPAVTGTNNQFKITCGIGREQGEALLRLLNKVLIDRLDPKAVMEKLDACLAQSAPRTVSEDASRELIQFLAPPQSSERPTVSIRATNSTAESGHYAEQLRNIFASAGWNAPQVFYNMVAGVPVDPGVVVIAQGNNSIPGLIVLKAFEATGIRAKYVANRSVAANNVVIVVGQKPID